jgi:hypothetical protein
MQIPLGSNPSSGAVFLFSIALEFFPVYPWPGLVLLLGKRSDNLVGISIYSTIMPELLKVGKMAGAPHLALS